MRILIAAGAAALALAACSPAAEEPTTAAPDTEIQSTTAPSVGGPTELPTDGGVTPAPESMDDASAEDVAAPASPAEAAVLSGGQQSAPKN
jgi:ABC-type glycerol-3-phosphate transport system substrate-binding protein